MLLVQLHRVHCLECNKKRSERSNCIKVCRLSMTSLLGSLEVAVIGELTYGTVNYTNRNISAVSVSGSNALHTAFQLPVIVKK